ncbi:MAG: TIGR01458 family HAD-type hydrolase [Candidatus Altiarchaeia archaeon]
MASKPSFLIDINGVLYTDNTPIAGAAETIDYLRDNKFSFRFISNATQSCRSTLHGKLKRFGFDIREKELFTAPIATARYVKKTKKLRCYLLTTGDVYKDFRKEGILRTGKKPDHVIIGDAGNEFTYERMNEAFNCLLAGADLIAMEKDRYWRSPEGLALCGGPYTAALEYSTGQRAHLIGKPSREFLHLALADMKAKPKDAIAIGDDLITDIAGAQRAGMRGFLVTSGKHKKGDVKRSVIKPDAVLDSITGLKNLF